MPVDTPNEEYRKYTLKWSRCRDTFDGADAVKSKRETYLPVLGGQEITPEQKAAYDSYLFHAIFFNAVAPTVTALTGAVFMKPMSLEKIPKPIEELFTDITMAGQTLEQFARDMVGQVVHPGRYGVLVDLPQEPSANPRPYVVAYRAEQIINWRTAVIDGEKVPTMVVLKETDAEATDDRFVDKVVDRFRVLELVAGIYTQTLWSESPTKKGEYIEGPTLIPTRRGEPLTFIPFTCVGPEGVIWEISDPPLMALTDMNLSHYLTMADLEWGSHWTALPTPVLSGVSDDTPVYIGSSRAIKLQDPNAKASYLEFTGQGLGALRENEKAKRLMMASLGGRLLDETGLQPATATEVLIRHSGEHASLLTIAMSCGQALSRVVQWMSWWLTQDTEIDKDPTVGLSTDFYPVKMTPDELSKLMLAWQANAISYETFFAALQDGGIYPPGTTLEDEKARIDAESEEAAQKALEIAQAQVGNDNQGDPIPELNN